VSEPLTDDQTRDAVREALDKLPPDIAAKLDNLAVIVEDSHPSGDLMGLYERRMGMHRITIYRDANPTADEVKKTVLHEIGHYFGMDEDRVREMGY
jgi:predicted Zn-dependent protease with MMP-like domain